MKASQQAHAEALDAWGSLNDYVQAHGSFSTEMAQIGPRSMMSFTTDINVARKFGSTVYVARIPRSQMIMQTLPHAGETEVLVQHMIAVMRL
jgi:hypothetical protein